MLHSGLHIKGGMPDIRNQVNEDGGEIRTSPLCCRGCIALAIKTDGSTINNATRYRTASSHDTRWCHFRMAVVCMCCFCFHDRVPSMPAI